MPHTDTTPSTPSSLRDAIRGLYLITDESPDLVSRVEDALYAPVSVLQFRRKRGSRNDNLAIARRLRELCRRRNVLFVVNDDPHLAREAEADGVHLGQEDGTVRDARQILGEGKLVGISTHTLDEARRAQEEGADYVGLGAMFPTGTKKIGHLAGPETLSLVRPHLSIPIVAIGGITRENAPTLVDRGADAIAVVSAVMGSPRPAFAAAELSLLFNRRRPFPRGSVLTVAGSDSGGGAGIQADIKTITLLGGYALSVLTSLTAQNTTGVTAIHHLPPPFVEEQLDAVFDDIPVDVVKTGMLDSAGIIEVVARRLKEAKGVLSVVDPVMVAKGGAALMAEDALSTFAERLLPAAWLVTPNIPEAERLTGLSIGAPEEMEEAAARLVEMGASAALVKGGHLSGAECVDILHDGRQIHRFHSPRIETRNTHGTGCTLAAAIATLVAGGFPLREAVSVSREFLRVALKTAPPLGRGHGPVNHFAAARHHFGDRQPNLEERVH